MYDDAKRYVDTGFRTNWDNYYKVYKGKRVIWHYEGISDPVIREAHTIIETLVANIAGGNPKFHFVKTNEEQANDTEVLNGMIDYYMACNQMSLKNQEWVREMLLYGTGVLHIAWRDGKPFIENIPLRNFFVDPTATGLVNCTNPARYAGFEYLASKESLRREMIYDPETDSMVPRYSNLDKISPNNSGSAAASNATDGDHGTMDKQFKDLFNGSTLGDKATENQVHVIRLYDLTTGRLVEIGNRKEFIYNKPTYCQREEQTRQVDVEVDLNGTITTKKITKKLDKIDPFLPFAILRDYVDTSLFYGEGEMAIILEDAELLNDYEAMDIDNNAYQNTPMYWIDPQFSDLVPELETIPGAVYPVPRNAIGALERPQLSSDLDQKKSRIIDRMRNATAANEVVQGNAPNKSRVTATEVSTQLSQAQGRFSTKISNLETEFAQLASVLFKFTQIFVTSETAVRVVGKKGIYFKDYDPWEYNGEWEPHAELDTTIKQKQMEVGQRDNQIFLQLSEDPHGVFDPVEIKRFIVQTINPDITDEKFNAMLAKPAPPPPPRDPFENINMSYKDAPPYIQQQIEAKMGMTPDPSHLGDMQNTMLQQANTAADHMNPSTDANNQPIPGMDHILNPQPPMPPQGMPQPA